MSVLDIADRLSHIVDAASDPSQTYLCGIKVSDIPISIAPKIMAWLAVQGCDAVVIDTQEE